MAESIDSALSRNYLVEVHKDVKRIPKFKGNVWKEAWVYCYGRGQWEFHGPNKFLYNCKATNAWEARALGWQAYIRERHPALFEQLEKEAIEAAAKMSQGPGK